MLLPIPKPGEEGSAVELRLVREGGVVRLEPAGFTGPFLLMWLLLTLVLFGGFGLLPMLTSSTAPRGFNWAFLGLAVCTWFAVAGILIWKVTCSHGLGPLCTFDRGTRVVSVPRESVTISAQQVVSVILIRFQLYSGGGGRTYCRVASQAGLLVHGLEAGELVVPIAMNPIRRSALRRLAEELGVPYVVHRAGTLQLSAWNERRLERPAG